MAKRKPYTTDELRGLTREELYKHSKALRDKLEKRRKGLEKAVEEAPHKYNPHGMRALNGERGQGIPTVSTKDSRNALIAKANRLQSLDSMVTTTKTGARKIQERHIRTQLDLPTTGRLRGDNLKRYKEGERYYEDNPDALSDFWKAFDRYKENMMHANIDSNQLLEIYRPTFNQAKEDGYQTIEELHKRTKDLVDEYDEEEAEDDVLSDRMSLTSKWGRPNT